MGENSKDFKEKTIETVRNWLPKIGKIAMIIPQLIIKIVKWRYKRWQRFWKLPLWRKFINLAFTIILTLLVITLLIDYNFLGIFGKSPTIKELTTSNQPIKTKIISADGKLIGTYFSENRREISYDSISTKLINTLISTEDIRFFKHLGVDIKGVIAATADIIRGNPRGASTITQQLVKNRFNTREKGSYGIWEKKKWAQVSLAKAKEWIAATKLELLYSKKEILEMYLNTVNFGENAYGIHTASKVFFNTTPDKLNYEQSALLVGLLKAVTKYNPYINPQSSIERRNIVLKQLATNGYITTNVADSLVKLPIKLNQHTNNLKPSDGIAPYFRNYLTLFLERWGDANGYNIYADGLKVIVTIDSKMQKYAEESAKESMRNLQISFFNHWKGKDPWRDSKGEILPDFINNIAKESDIYRSLSRKYRGNEDSINRYMRLPQEREIYDFNTEQNHKIEISAIDSIRYMNHFLHCGFVAIEPQTKYVKAWVGDINYNYWQYDKVSQSKRQSGSTFKLFVYTAAINAGKSPCNKIKDEPFEWDFDGTLWQPNNSNKQFSNSSMTLKSAFARSVNSIAAKLTKEVGIDKVIKTAHTLGVMSKLDSVPTISLGVSDVSLLEMVNSYSTIAADGNFSLPVVVTEIFDRNGNSIYKYKGVPQRVLSYENAFLMQIMLKAGVTELGGTSRGLYNYDIMRWDTDFGGKTGSTSNYSDGWYIGITPNLVAGAWVGAEHRSIHFRNGYLGQGSRTALPIYANFMQKILSDTTLTRYRGRFDKEPKIKIKREYKCNTATKKNVKFNAFMHLNPIEALPKRR